MSIALDRLDNGLTVISHDMPHLETVALGVWVRAGTRDEAESENGIAHLIEHMAFKGTTTRSALQIASEIEAAGGDLNASTSMENTAYYARVLREDWRLALEILADILVNPVFTPADLDLEKEVILQEIAAAQDTPDDLVFELAQGRAWSGHAMGRDILGTPASVTAFDEAAIAAYRDSHYDPRHMVISAAGRIDHRQLVAEAARLFGHLRHRPHAARTAPGFVGGPGIARRRLDQLHQVISFRSPGYLDPDIYAVQLMSGLLGGGMSSRLFQEVREKRGLCYSTFTYAQAYADCGLFSVYAGTAPRHAREFVDVASDVLLSVTANVGSDELERARAQTKASLVMSLESPGARADQMARQYLALGRVPDVKDILARIDAVTVEDIVRVAGQVFRAGPPAFAAVGDTSKLAKYDDVAARFA